jgi:hypothetical protein
MVGCGQVVVVGCAVVVVVVVVVGSAVVAVVAVGREVVIGFGRVVLGRPEVAGAPLVAVVGCGAAVAGADVVVGSAAGSVDSGGTVASWPGCEAATCTAGLSPCPAQPAADSATTTATASLRVTPFAQRVPAAAGRPVGRGAARRGASQSEWTSMARVVSGTGSSD